MKIVEGGVVVCGVEVGGDFIEVDYVVLVVGYCSVELMLLGLCLLLYLFKGYSLILLVGVQYCVLDISIIDYDCKIVYV